jgi:hypothetical protein
VRPRVKACIARPATQTRIQPGAAHRRRRPVPYRRELPECPVAAVGR